MADSIGNSGVSNETIEAFHMMWDKFPWVVLLNKKNRDIVAANKVAEEMGYHPGEKCFHVAKSTEIHASCKANEALEKGVAQRSVSYNKETNQVMDAYWVPVSAEQDLYVHFALWLKIPPDDQSGQ